MFEWQTSRRRIMLDRTLVMAILNVTPDSFSDGGKAYSVDDALRQAESNIVDGADMIDVGGESTRPGAGRVSAGEEIDRVLPVIEAIKERFDIPISIDSTKSEVAAAALAAGAEIVNDISGLRFDDRSAEVAARYGAGLVLMHSRGSFETMHEQKYPADVFEDVCRGFRGSLARAESAGVRPECIALDIGIGFGKSFNQNLQLIADVDHFTEEFPDYPMLVGASRKSFIGKILGGVPAGERLNGSLATAAIAAWNGAKIIRVHDVRQTVEALKIVDAIKASAVGLNT